MAKKTTIIETKQRGARQAGRQIRTGIGDGAKAAAREVGGLNKGLSALAAGGALAVAGIATVNLTRGLVRQLSEAADLARVQREATAQVRSAIESTGAAAGLATPQVVEMAGSLQQLNGVGDETILKFQSVLLTFTNIGSGVFERTSQAVLDVAARMSSAGGEMADAKSVAVQLGKALNDPITGLSALSRTGITFTETQKETIRTLQESGRIAEAQGLILEELERQFGGAAAAAAETRPYVALGNTVGDLKEILGEGLLPALDQVARALNALAGSPGFKNYLIGIAATVRVTTGALIELGSVSARIFEAFKDNGRIAAVGQLFEEIKRATQGGSIAERLALEFAKIDLQLKGLGSSSQSAAAGFTALRETAQKELEDTADAAEEAAKKIKRSFSPFETDQVGFLLFPSGTIDEIEKVAEARAEAERTAADAAEESLEDQETAMAGFLEGIQGLWSSTIRDIARDGFDSFESLFDRILDLAIDAAIKLAKQQFVVNVAANASGGGGSGGGVAGSAAKAGANIWSGSGGFGAFKAGFQGVSGGGFANTAGGALAAFWPALVVAAVGVVANYLIENGKKNTIRASGSLELIDGELRSTAIGTGKDAEFLLSVLDGYKSAISEVTALVGGSLAELAGIFVDIRNDGKVKLTVGDQVIGRFGKKKIEEGLAEALRVALQSANFDGISEDFANVLSRSTATTLDELLADLALVEGPLSDLRQSVLGVGSSVDAFLGKARELGLSLETIGEGVDRIVDSARADVFGASVGDFGDRLLAFRDLLRQMPGILDGLAGTYAGGGGGGFGGFAGGIPGGRGGLGGGQTGGTGGGRLDEIVPTQLFSRIGETIGQEAQQSLLDGVENIDLDDFALSLIGEAIGGANTLGALETVRQNFQALDAAIRNAGFAADVEAQLLKQSAELRLKAAAVVEADVLQRLVNILKQIPGQEQAAAELQAKIDQARARVEIERLEIDLKVLGLWSKTYAKMIETARGFFEDLGNLRVDIPTISIPSFSTPEFTPVSFTPVSFTPSSNDNFDEDNRENEIEAFRETLESYQRLDLSGVNSEMVSLLEDFDQLYQDAPRLGQSIKEVSDTFQKAVEDLIANAFEPLVKLRNDLNLSQFSPLSLKDQLAEAFLLIDDLQGALDGGDLNVIGDLSSAFNEAFALNRQLYGTGGSGQDIFDDLKAKLDASISSQDELSKQFVEDPISASIGTLTELQSVELSRLNRTAEDQRQLLTDIRAHLSTLVTESKVA